MVATGGLASMIAEHSETIEKVEPDLTLHGLRIIHDLNQRAGNRARPGKPGKRARPGPGKRAE